MAKPAREPLSRERILSSALEILDHDGLDAISMRRVGEALEVEAMSLYKHVAHKAAILDGVFELILGELPPQRRANSWQSVLRERARALRAVLRAHPNALPLFATRPAVTPASIAHVEAALQVLRAAGFSTLDALRSFQVLVAFVVGHTVSAHAPRRPDDESQPDYARLDPELFPRMREAARQLTDYDVDAEFDHGLEALLGGLERHAR